MKEETLKQIEDLARLMFTIQEISIIIEIPCQDLKAELQDKTSPAFKHFTRGRLQSETEIRKAVFDLAKNGSSPAQTTVLELIEKAKMDDDI